jgi:hypothetical protein
MKVATINRKRIIKEHQGGQQNDDNNNDDDDNNNNNNNRARTAIAIDDVEYLMDANLRAVVGGFWQSPAFFGVTLASCHICVTATAFA